MTNKQKTILKAIAFFATGFAVLFLVYYKQNQQYLEELVTRGIDPEGKSLFLKILASFGEAKIYVLIVVLVCFMISNVSRAIRWQILIEPIRNKTSFINAISSIMAAYLVNLGIPRSGEFVRAGLFSRYEKLPPEKVMGTIVTDRVVDVICLLVVIGLACIFSFDDLYRYYITVSTDNPDAGNRLLFVLLALGLVVVLATYFAYKFRVRLFKTVPGKKLLNLILGFAEGLKTVFLLRKPWQFLFHSIVIWLMYYLMTYLSFFAIAPTSHLSPVAGLVVFVFGTLGFVFPAPGGIGSYQYLVSEALTNFYGLNIGDASSFANIVFFAVTIFGNVFFGIISFILLPIFNARYEPHIQDEPGR